MKILIFGRGVISTQYAWAFEKAGHTVEFYVRQGRKADYGSTVALNIYDSRKKIRGVLVNENWNITLHEDMDTNHDYDLIFVCVQHYHLKSVVDFLTNKTGKATILIANNFWEEPQEMASKLPKDQLVWGFPGAGGGFDENGVLNGSLFGTFTIGTFGTELSTRDLQVIDLFESSGFKVKEIKDLRSWLFSHFVLNAAMHLERLKSNKETMSLNDLKTTKFWRNVILNGKELLPLLKARNVNLNASFETKMFSLPPWIFSFLMRIIIKFLPPLKQIFTAHTNHKEVVKTVQDVMNKAEEMNISLPRYEANKNRYQ